MGVVLAPVNGKGSAARLVEAGAGELYWGFADAAWTDRFGRYACLNRMSGFGEEANSLSFEELLDEVRATRAQEAARAAKPAAGDAPVADDAGAAAADGTAAEPLGLFCTFNSPHYSSEQLRFIAQRYLPQLAQAGLTAVIVSEPTLIPLAREAGLGAVASTMCSVYNEELARFYADAGATRIILPRDLALDEIERIVAAVPGPSYEVFLMRNGCAFADSHCLGLHRAGCPSLCRSLRTATRWEIPVADEDGVPTGEGYLAQRWDAGTLHRERFHKSACGQCALWRMEQAGIAAYKVVGRGDHLDDLATDVALTERNLRIARRCATHEEYLERMHRPEWLRTLCRDEGLSCYYPEVRAGA